MDTAAPLLAHTRTTYTTGKVARFDRTGVVLEDGTHIAVDVVIYCTGHENPFDSILERVLATSSSAGHSQASEVAQADARTSGSAGAGTSLIGEDRAQPINEANGDGPYLYRGMIHPDVPGLAFIGCKVSIDGDLHGDQQFD